ncbi:MAG: hypothetical protein QXR89_05845 [Candidatus Bathyarchaeia archaeon]
MNYRPMFIYIKGCYALIGEIASNLKENRIRFKVALKDKPPVIVEINPTEKIIESFHEADISEDLREVLNRDSVDIRKLPEDIQTQISEITSIISLATRKVLNLIKYCLNQTELDENLFSVKGYYWSKDRLEWKHFPMLTKLVVDIKNVTPLNEDNAKIIQEYLDNDFQPFLALRHLHRAKNEDNPRYKWIEATIAAELAIKEFLIRKKPEVEALLIEIPSPPLHKLYGSILESFTGQKSPKLKELQKGAEIRNKLIHRPKEIDISAQEANKYVQDVEIAIGHLLTMLYPENHV